MTTFLPSFCYYLSVFLTTEYHLLIEVHESLNRIFPVFMRASGDTEISLPHFRWQFPCVNWKPCIYAACRCFMFLFDPLLTHFFFFFSVSCFFQIFKPLPKISFHQQNSLLSHLLKICSIYRKRRYEARTLNCDSGFIPPIFSLSDSLTYFFSF